MGFREEPADVSGWLHEYQDALGKAPHRDGSLLLFSIKLWPEPKLFILLERLRHSRSLKVLHNRALEWKRKRDAISLSRAFRPIVFSHLTSR